MRKKSNKNKKTNVNQKSFYFEDYFETNKKNRYLQTNNSSQDRIYFDYEPVGLNSYATRKVTKIRHRRRSNKK